MSMPNPKIRRRRKAGMNWNTEWDNFLGNFQTLHKKMNFEP
jgi:hypothetical protein